MIEKRVALLNPEKIGLGLTVFVSIETSDHSGSWLQRFAEFVSAMPEVMEFYRMAGDVDYMLRVVVADMAAYDLFYKRLIDAIPLRNVTSRFAMQRVKSTTAFALPVADAQTEPGGNESIAFASGQMVARSSGHDRSEDIRCHSPVLAAYSLLRPEKRIGSRFKAVFAARRVVAVMRSASKRAFRTTAFSGDPPKFQQPQR